jgi:hypothetical protein
MGIRATGRKIRFDVRAAADLLMARWSNAGTKPTFGDIRRQLTEPTQ